MTRKPMAVRVAGYSRQFRSLVGYFFRGASPAAFAFARIAIPVRPALAPAPIAVPPRFMIVFPRASVAPTMVLPLPMLASGGAPTNVLLSPIRGKRPLCFRQ